MNDTSRNNNSRQFKKGVIEIVILKLLCEKEMYGYELAAQLNQRGQSLNIREGTLYPILYRLEDDGLIQTRWQQAGAREKPKKYYWVTPKGEQVMRESYAQWKAFAQDIVNIMED